MGIGIKNVKSQVCKSAWSYMSEEQQGVCRVGQNEGWREELERGQFLRAEVQRAMQGLRPL